MTRRDKDFLVTFAILLIWCLPKITAQETSPGASPQDATQVQTPALPYIAEITADNVNIRSGPGTNYYACGKLNKGDKVKVVGTQFGWSRIVPPKGSFSWIAKQHISIDPNDSTTGIVSADGIRVYAGSDYVKPIHSTTMQLKLNKGDKVKLAGKEEGDYLKIDPPAGVYLWADTSYTKPTDAQEAPLAEIVPVSTTPTDETKATEPVTQENPIETQKLQEYDKLEKQVAAEKTKPLLEQNYQEIKKALSEIVNNAQAGKAARYSKFTLDQIGRYELATEVAKAIQLQDEQLVQAKDQIEKATATRLAEFIDLGSFAAVGTFKESKIFGPEPALKRYLITDDADKIICYATPSEPIPQADIDTSVGQKVGLVGTVEAEPQTAGPLVRFTKIVKIK